MRLRIDERQSGNVTVLDLSGQLVMGLESDNLGREIQRLIADERTNILLNVKDVVFIDSSGLGELVTSLTVVKKSGGALKLAHATDLFRDVLQATRLVNVFELYETEDEALASFA